MSMKKGMGQRWTLRTIKNMNDDCTTVNDGVRYTYSTRRRFNEKCIVCNSRKANRT